MKSRERTPQKAAAGKRSSSRVSQKTSNLSRPAHQSAPAGTPRVPTGGKTGPSAQLTAGPSPLPETTAPKESKPRKPVTLPPILLAGDLPPVAPADGPGERYVLGPGRPESLRSQISPSRDLPEDCGPQRLFLAARDPHSVYTAWDLPPEVQQKFNSLSKDGHLTVKAFVGAASGSPVVEVPVLRESKSCFVPVERGATSYVTALGYHGRDGHWHPVAISNPALTPPESPSKEDQAEFATLPIEFSLADLASTVRDALQEKTGALAGLFQSPTGSTVPATQVEPEPSREAIPWTETLRHMRAGSAGPLPENTPAARKEETPNTVRHLAEVIQQAIRAKAPLIDAIRQLRAAGWQGLPEVAFPRPQSWTRAQALALAEVGKWAAQRRFSLGSLELVELLRGHAQNEVLSQAVPVRGEGATASPQPGLARAGVSSQAGPQPEAVPAQGSFWFNVNAELIIYGATEPNARVAVGGRDIQLRPDGSFSCRFALPDGQYSLVIRAESADGVHVRGTQLEFNRNTKHEGVVEAHPQDPALKPPSEASFR